MGKTLAVFASCLLLLTGCASSRYSCGVPDGKRCISATDVYKQDVLGEKPGQDEEEAKGKSEKVRITDQMDRFFHNFPGSFQDGNEVKRSGVLSLVRDPVYRTIYCPAKTTYTRSGRPVNILPHILVVEQVPGGFITGGSPDETSRTQFAIPYVVK